MELTLICRWWMDLLSFSRWLIIFPDTIYWVICLFSSNVKYHSYHTQNSTVHLYSFIYQSCWFIMKMFISQEEELILKPPTLFPGESVIKIVFLLLVTIILILLKDRPELYLSACSGRLGFSRSWIFVIFIFVEEFVCMCMMYVHVCDCGLMYSMVCVLSVLILLVLR